jgi:hypothetical protein
MHVDPAYFDHEQKNVQTLDNVFGTILSPMYPVRRVRLSATKEKPSNSRAFLTALAAKP